MAGRSQITHRNESMQMVSRHLRRHVNGWIDSVFVTAAALIISITPAVVLWDFGGVLPWTRQWVCAAIGVAALISLPVVLKNARLHSPFTLLVPLLCVVVWLAGTAQTWQLPGGLVRWLAPGSAAAYTQWVPAQIWAEAGASVDTVRTGADSQLYPISVCVWLTRQWLALPALFGYTAFLSGFVFRTRRAVQLLLWVTALSGTALACVGMLMIVRAGEETTMPRIDMHIQEIFLNATPFGPIVCRNNAAGYLTLSIGCTFGLLVMLATERRRADRFDERFEGEGEGEGDDVWGWVRGRLDSMILAANATSITIASLAIVQFAGILACGSRGGILAAMSGIVFCILKMSHSGAVRFLGVLTVLGAIAAAGILSRLQLSQSVAERIGSTFSTSEGSQVGRLLHWQDSLVAAANYFPMGSGVGTYRYAYLQTHRFTPSFWFVNADSMPMEWLVEGGIWLLPCILIGVIAFGVATGKIARRIHEPHCQALAGASWFAIAAIPVAQCFDFGILLPPVYLTLAALVGAVFGVLKTPSPISNTRQTEFDPMVPAAPVGGEEKDDIETQIVLGTSQPVVNGFLTTGLLLAFLGGWALSWQSTRQAAISDYVIREVNRSPSKISDVQLEGLLKQTIAYDPLLQLVVAEALINNQTSKAVIPTTVGLDSRESGKIRGQARIAVRRAVYHALRNRSLERRQTPPPPTAVLLPGQNWDDLLYSRQLAAVSKTLCPLDFRSNVLLIHTDFVADDDSEMIDQLIQQCIEMWPENTEIVETLARLAFAFPGYDSAVPLIARFLSLSPNRFGDAWPLINELGDTSTMLGAFPDDPEPLVNAIVSGKLPPDLEEVLTSKARDLLETENIELEPSRILYLRSLLWGRQGNFDAAIQSLAQSLEIDPARTAYRQKYVQLLDSAGQTEAAIEQLRRCIAQKPNDRGLTKKLEMLIKKSLDKKSSQGKGFRH